jgi:predicted ATPase/class 3 adenylate cyclase
VVSPSTCTVTFLFTDIEGSTRLWESNPEAMSEALARHDEILRAVIEANNGSVVKTTGDGVHAVFSAATDALEAALEAQRALIREEWAESGPLRVRMALNTGATEERDGDYYGPPVNLAARLLSAAHGGQVLLSSPTQELVHDTLPAGAILDDLGERHLKDLFRPERVFQLVSPDLPSEFPPLRTLEAYRNNLPLQPTPLVGREEEVSEVCDLLGGEATRLLTLTGPGGIGKTRLALQAAADLLDDFPEGTFFVPLATVTEAELLLPAVAETLGVREAGEQSLDESLKEYLNERRLLLLLDNFEQILEAAPAVTDLLGGAPGLKVLATSRAPLGLYGEHEFPVPALTLPDLERPPPLERLMQYEAVGLFVERARAVKPDISITNESALAVAEICVRLDGLPLAIELAAARTKLLPPQAMLARLGSRLKLLRGGARDLPERQRTLRATIEWSYELLDEGEKTLFARLSVFSGGRTLEAVEAVCDTEGDLSVDVLEGISSLLDKNLIGQEEGMESEPRFVMLETIHEYARERLEENGEAEEVRRLHAEYFLALAEEAEPELWGSEDTAWIGRLEAEHDNMRVALSWALGGADVELSLHLAGALGEFWHARGYYEEGKRWLEGALAKGGRAPAAAYVKALDALGWLAIERGDMKGVEAAAEEGLELGTQEGIESTRKASFLRMLGATARIRGDHERAKELYEESLAFSREAGDRWGIANALVSLGWAAVVQGDHERGKGLYEEGLVLSRELGSAQPLGDLLIALGYEYLLEGDYERATALNEEAAALLRTRGHRGVLQYALDNLGWAALLRGDHERARKLHEESLVLSRELGNRVIAAESLEGLACTAGARGEAERAAKLFGAAEALREAVGYWQEPRERELREPYLRAVRSQIDEASWESVFAEGQAMTFEEAAEYALSN